MEQNSSQRPDGRLLAADDDFLTRQVLERLARAVGIEVEIVENGLKAWERVAKMPPRHFTAVLLDMRMPLYDGRDAACSIRSLGGARGSIPIYAMSGSEAQLVRNPWASWLFTGSIAKPLDQADLTAILAAHRPPAPTGHAFAPTPALRDYRISKLDRIASDLEEAIERNDHAQAAESALRIRDLLRGCVPEQLTNTLRTFQLGQAHRKCSAALSAAALQSVSQAKSMLMAQ